eukprot:m.63705 g.63705  ORF g.63705 m.63705 type:complete len:659 (-) comp11597_c0_seq1:1039-3015(-)
MEGILPLDITEDMFDSPRAQYSALMAAVVKNDVKKVKKLIRSPDLQLIINTRSELTLNSNLGSCTDEFNALETACWFGHAEVAEMLIVHGRAKLQPFSLSNPDNNKTELNSTSASSILSSFSESRPGSSRSSRHESKISLEKLKIGTSRRESSAKFRGKCSMVDDNLTSPSATSIRSKGKKKKKVAPGGSPLHHACVRGHRKLVMQLISKHGANVNFIRQDSKQSPLTSAVYAYLECRGSRILDAFKTYTEELLRIIRYLLQQGADPNHLISKNDPFPPLYFSCMNGAEELVRILLQYGANADYVNNKIPEDNFSVLACAASAGNMRAVEILVKEGNADPNLTSNLSKKTVLHCAASHNHRDIFEWLVVEAGANINARTSKGEGPIHVAIINAALQVVQWCLQDGGISPDETVQKNEKTCMQLASEHGHLEIVKFLVSQTATINQQDASGNTALHWAIHAGQMDVVDWLCSLEDTDLELTCTHDYPSPRDQASHDTEERVGDKTNLMRVEASPMILAIILNHERALRRVLQETKDRGLLPAHLESCEANSGLKPLHFAVQSGSLDLVKILVEEGGASTIQPDEAAYNPPSYVACELGHIGILDYLVEKGDFRRDLQILETRGLSPTYAARQGGHTEIMKYIEKLLKRYERESNVNKEE